MNDEEVSEEQIIQHLSAVAHRVAQRIAESAPDEFREGAERAAREVLSTDEAARELLAAAFEEGRADAINGALARGKIKLAAPDWSDVESLGERKAIAREDHACATCSKSPVCMVANAIRSSGALIVLQRCDQHG